MRQISLRCKSSNSDGFIVADSNIPECNHTENRADRAA
jgi:hypothetical protein